MINDIFAPERRARSSCSTRHLNAGTEAAAAHGYLPEEARACIPR